MSVVEIDSEKEINIVETDPLLGPSTHCVIIMEQPPLMGRAQLPRWRVAATLTLYDVALGPDALLADLPTVYVGPLIHKREVIAVARYPGRVRRWSFRFESDEGRAKNLVWLHPGISNMDQCGIFPIHSSLRR